MGSLIRQVSALHNACHIEIWSPARLGLEQQPRDSFKVFDQREITITDRRSCGVNSKVPLFADVGRLPLTPLAHARPQACRKKAAWCNFKPFRRSPFQIRHRKEGNCRRLAAANELAQTLDLSNAPVFEALENATNETETANSNQSTNLTNGVTDKASEREHSSSEAETSGRECMEDGRGDRSEGQDRGRTEPDVGLEGLTETEEVLNEEETLSVQDTKRRNEAQRRKEAALQGAGEPLEVEVRLAETKDELMAAACLRADVYASGLPYTRFIDSYRKQFTQQEFGSLLKRTKEQTGRHIRCRCLVAVDTKALASSSPASDYVIGTLDVSLKQLMPGQRIPGELPSHDSVTFVGKRPVTKARKFAYVSNVCVPENARRKGVARRMMAAAAEVAQSWDLGEVYCHVDVENKGAQNLYDKLGYEKRGEVVVQENVSGAHVSLQRTLLLRAPSAMSSL